MSNETIQETRTPTHSFEVNSVIILSDDAVYLLSARETCGFINNICNRVFVGLGDGSEATPSPVAPSPKA